MAEHHQLVHPVAVPLGQSALPLGLFLHSSLISLTTPAGKVVVVGAGPIGPREVPAPPGPRVAGLDGLRIPNVAPVGFDDGPDVAG